MGYQIQTVTGELKEYAFDIGGVLALRNFTASTNGNRLIVKSHNNANFTILDALVNEVEIDGVVYDDVVSAQEALQRLVFNPAIPQIITEEQRLKIINSLQKNSKGSAIKFFNEKGELITLDLSKKLSIEDFLLIQKSNLIIGGVGASTMSTKTKLASFFSFTETDIAHFKIIENTVYATITNENYNLTQWLYQNLELTSFIEKDGFLKDITAYSNTFNGCTNLKYFEVQCEALMMQGMFQNCTSLSPSKIKLQKLKEIVKGSYTFCLLKDDGTELYLPFLEKMNGSMMFRYDNRMSFNAPKLKEIKGQPFAYSDQLSAVLLPSLEICGNTTFDKGGAHGVGDGVFSSFRSTGDKITKTKIVLNSKLLTSNNGVPDTDALYLINGFNSADKKPNLWTIEVDLELVGTNPRLGITDENGIEKFAIDLPEKLRLKGGLFNEPLNMWEASPLNPNVSYVHSLLGNDSTAEINNYDKKFKTLEACFQKIQSEFSVLSTPIGKINYPTNIIVIQDQSTQTITNDTQASYRVVSDKKCSVVFAPTAQLYSYPFHNFLVRKDFYLPNGSITWNKSFQGLGANWQYAYCDWVVKDINFTHNFTTDEVFITLACFDRLEVSHLKIKGIFLQRSYLSKVKHRGMKVHIKYLEFDGDGSIFIGDFAGNYQSDFFVEILCNKAVGTTNVTNKKNATIVGGAFDGTKIDLIIGYVENCNLVGGGINTTIKFKDCIIKNASLFSSHIYNEGARLKILGNIKDYQCEGTDVNLCGNAVNNLLFENFTLEKVTWTNPNNIDGKTLNMFYNGYDGFGFKMNNAKFLNIPFKFMQIGSVNGQLKSYIINSIVTTLGAFNPMFTRNNTQATIDVYGDFDTNFDPTTNTNISLTKTTTHKF